jgi:excinuclease UvrABC helicase subunit UvrB
VQKEQTRPHTPERRCAELTPSGRALLDSIGDRTEGDFRRRTSRVRGDTIEICPSYDDYAYRIELWGDEMESPSQAPRKWHCVLSAKSQTCGISDNVNHYDYPKDTAR